MKLRSESSSLNSFSFESRKNQTLVEVMTEDGKLHPRLVSENHIVILQQPKSSYLGYIVAKENSKSPEIAVNIISFFREKNYNISNLYGVCCDGEPKNTGIHNGVLRNMEINLGKPLHWFVCLLHLNELPFRHILEKIDSSITTGPRLGTGKITKVIEYVNLPIKNFKPLPFLDDRMPPGIEYFELSVDEKYLFEMSIAVSSGICPPTLANKKPGPIHHARWLTKACRLLRLYVSIEEPTHNLINLVTYVMRVYVPTYFAIKFKFSCKYGSTHFFNIIKYSRESLPEKYFEIVKKVLSNNSYFAHCENILLAMLFDDNMDIRRGALLKIIEARNNAEDMYNTIREYKHPLIIFDCQNYKELSRWDNNITEQPFTLIKPMEDLKLLLETNGIMDDDVIDIHIQATERHIQLVSEVSKAAAAKERREGIIASKIYSRQKRTKFEAKRYFS